jgi:hypothetical protein
MLALQKKNLNLNKPNRILYQLHGSDVLFPPELLSQAGYGREGIVQVHDDMHARVEPRAQPDLTTRNPCDRDPPDHQHCRVVEHVQESDLVVLFADDHEERVQEFDGLREEVPPDGIHNLE